MSSSQVPLLLSRRWLFRHLNHTKHYRSTKTLASFSATIPPPPSSSIQQFSTQSSPSPSSSTTTTPPKAVCDISKHISGITNDDLEQHPALVEYITANMPHLFGMEPKTATEQLIENNPHVHHYFLHEDDDDDDDDEQKHHHSKAKKSKTKQEFNQERTNTRHGLERQALLLNNQQQPSSSSSSSSSNRNIRPLFSYLRDPVTEEGTRNCDILRQNSYIPGVLYGTGPTTSSSSSSSSNRVFVKTPWSELQRELDRYAHNTFPSRVYDLTIFPNDDIHNQDPGTTYRVLPRDVQFHPWKNIVYCCNYLRYHPKQPIDIPIVYTNEEESSALKRGGFIAPINRYVSCIVEDGVDIPERIEMDCTGLKLKDVIRTERFVFPDGVVMSKKVRLDTFLVGTVFGRRGEMGAEGMAVSGSDGGGGGGEDE